MPSRNSAHFSPRAAPELICKLIGHISNSTRPLVRSHCNRASRREFGTKTAIRKQLRGGPYGSAMAQSINLVPSKFCDLRGLIRGTWLSVRKRCTWSTHAWMSWRLTGSCYPQAVPVSLAGVRHSSTGHLPFPSAVRIISSLRTRPVAARIGDCSLPLHDGHCDKRSARVTT